MYSPGSHKKILVECTCGISPKCVGSHEMIYKDYYANQQRNDGNYICLYCSRQVKYSGRNNPNTKYKDMNDNYFATVDSEKKAYILGFIASDGSLTDDTVRIKVRNKDFDIIAKIRDAICPSGVIKHKNEDVYIVFSSTKLCSDACILLGIEQGKKSHTIGQPQIPEEFYCAFIRGFFDGDGSITDTMQNKKNYLQATITTSSVVLRDWIQDTIGIPGYCEDDTLEWSCNNALDFLGKIYEGASIYMDRKHDLYRMWCEYVPGLSGRGSSAQLGNIKVIRTRKDAVLPSKARVSDSGYDLTIIEKIKQVGDVEFFTTGIKICPEMGWYTTIVPRSSISKTGYMLANCVGIIDRTYLGEVIIALRKVDKEAKDIALPCRIAQFIPSPIVHMQIEEVQEEDVDRTQRGSGGFGSTDKS